MASLTKAEQSEIKSELEEFEDEFDDAVQTEGELKDVEGNFGVSREELTILRADLACEFPEDYDYLRYGMLFNGYFYISFLFI